MKVILTKDIPSIGKARELKTVKTGYALNYLFPNGLAMEATKENIKKLEDILAEEKAKEEALRKEAEENKKLLEGKNITVKTKIGPDGKLYGAITSKDVADYIKENTSLEIDKRKIVMDNIKTIGTYSVIIKLYPKVEAKINVDIQGE